MQAKFCEGLENRATSEFNRMQKHDWENVCSLFAKVHSSFDFKVVKCDKKLIGVQSNHSVEYFGGPAVPTQQFPHNQWFPHNQCVF